MEARQWTSAEELYRFLAAALERGEGPSLARDAQRLVELEGGTERACVAIAIILQRSGEAARAEGVLRAYLTERGPTAVVLINLAKLQAERGDEAGALALGRRAVQLGPNQDNGLWWWASLARKLGPEPAARAELEAVTRLPGSFRAHLVLASWALERGEEDAAQQRLQQALAAAAFPGEPMAWGARRWLQQGRPARAAALLADYSPARDGLAPGLCLLEAFEALSREDDARSLASKLHALPGGARAPQVLRWAQRLAQEEAAARAVSAPTVGLALFAPLWAAPLEGALAWLSPPPKAGARSVAITTFCTSDGRAPSPGPVEPSDDDDVARGLPLALAEALRERGVETYTLVPVLQGVGLVSPTFRLELEQWLALLPKRHLPRVLVTGSLTRGLMGERQLELELIDLARRAVVTTARAFGKRTEAELLESALRQLRRPLADAGVALEEGPRPGGEVRALAAALPTFALGAGVVERACVAGFTGGLEVCLDAALKHPEALQPGLLAVAVFLEGRRAGLPGFERFDDAMGQLVCDEGRPALLRRLAPLLFARLGDGAAFAREAARWREGAEGAYLAWLQRLAPPPPGG